MIAVVEKRRLRQLVCLSIVKLRKKKDPREEGLSLSTSERFYFFFVVPFRLGLAAFVAILRFGATAFFVVALRFGAAFWVFFLGAARPFSVLFLTVPFFFTALRFGAVFATPFFLTTAFFLAVARFVVLFFVALRVVAISLPLRRSKNELTFEYNRLLSKY
jgi:hypothetical protein